MKILIAGGTGAVGRPLVAELLAKGHNVVALTRSAEKAQALAEQGVEPAIVDVFDAERVKAVVHRAQPEVVIEQLTALPKTYTPESMSAAAAFNHRIRTRRWRKRAGSCPSGWRATLPEAVDRILGNSQSWIGERGNAFGFRRIASGCC